jgi:hypothetical protein
LRYGWRESSVIKKSTKEEAVVTTYYNTISNERSLIPPLYTPEDNFGAKKLQSIWKVYRSRQFFKKLLMKESIATIIESTIDKYQRIAYVGYRLEGLTVTQLLHRAGYWELAQVIDEFFKVRQTAFQNLTMEHIMNLSKENFHSIGLTEREDHIPIIKSLIQCQNWWRKASIGQKEGSLTLINYFKSPEDRRDILSCIQDSEEELLKRFTKMFPNNMTRLQSLCKDIVSRTHFPIARRQLDTYLQKYAGKAAQAQVHSFT